MKATVSDWHANGACVWCEKTKECVTVEFSDGFLSQNQLCWQCFAKAVKVRSQKSKPSAEAQVSARPVAVPGQTTAPPRPQPREPE